MILKSVINAAAQLGRRAIGGVMHLITPHVCAFCGRVLTDNEDALCLHCIMQLPRLVEDGVVMDIMCQRLHFRPRVNFAMTWIKYRRDSELSQLIVEGKYYGQLTILEGFMRMFMAELDERGIDLRAYADVVVPVPMHWLREVQRGYNQAEAIARVVAKHTGLPLRKHLYTKKLYRHQVGLGSDGRARNMQGKFGCRPATLPAGLRVLVIDDVMTTGATLRTCLAALADAGVESASVLTLACTAYGD